MDNVKEYVPTEEELPSDHWSKSPEYLAEKELIQKTEVRGGMLSKTGHFVDPKTGKELTTHQVTQRSFMVEYVPSEEEKASYEKTAQIRKEYFEGNEKIFEEMAEDILKNVEKSLKEKE